METESAEARGRVDLVGYESARLASLHSYQILDTERDIVFDRLTRVAAEAFRAPVAGIVFLDAQRLWFKAQLGLDLVRHPDRIGCCVPAMLAKEVLVVEDTAKDTRRILGPFISGQAFYRFYAGAPLFAPGGLRLGTICVLDYQPRCISAEQAGQLDRLAARVMLALEVRRGRLCCRVEAAGR